MVPDDLDWRLPATYLRVLLQEARAAGMDSAPLLAATGLAADTTLAEDEPVSLVSTLKVLQNAERLLGAGWHLRFAERLTVASHGPLGFAVVTARDISAAVTVIQRFIGTRAPFLWSAGAVEDNDYVLRFYQTSELGAQRGVLMEIAALSLQSLLERPLGRTISGATLEFSHAAPVYAADFEQAFHGDVVFSADQHRFRFPLAWLEEPCALHDDAMHEYLVSRCEDELIASAGVLPPEVSVRQAILADPGAVPGLEEIARSLHVSRRTLIRRLKQADTSYQEILDNVRKTLSRDYLRNSQMTISTIAHQLGYQDPSNFGRAFRTWFGMAPGQFRRQAASKAMHPESD
jgi:AraC-like DNA-binding protein